MSEEESPFQHSLDAAIDKAISFLLDSRSKSGWWKDFSTLAGQSDEWVTAYTGVAMASTHVHTALDAAARAWKNLNRRNWWSAGWGYNRLVPSDADSTIWAVRLAECLNYTQSLKLRRSLRFLKKHISTEGGISTFKTRTPISKYTRLNNVKFNGWCSPHICVSAAACHLNTIPEKQPILSYLIQSQNPDGGWTGYWWCDDEYTTSLVAEAIAPHPELISNYNRAAAWSFRLLDEYPGHTITPFVLSSLLRIIIFSDDTSAVSRYLKNWLPLLISQQKEDGSWESSARLRIPHPDMVYPAFFQHWRVGGKGTNSIVHDLNAIFTTATVLYTIQKIREEFKRAI